MASRRTAGRRGGEDTGPRAARSGQTLWQYRGAGQDRHRDAKRASSWCWRAHRGAGSRLPHSPDALVTRFFEGPGTPLRVLVGIRPEAIQPTGAGAVMRVTVQTTEHAGADCFTSFTIGGTPVTARLPGGTQIVPAGRWPSSSTRRPSAISIPIAGFGSGDVRPRRWAAARRQNVRRDWRPCGRPSGRGSGG